MIRSGIVPLLLGLAAAGLFGQTPLEAQTTNQLSEFQEVYDLVRDNVAGIKPEELDHAAAVGLALALSPRVSLVTNYASVSAGNSSDAPLLLKSNLFEGQIAYARVGRVSEGLAAAIKSACNQLISTNKLKGVVLDLRFAGGDDLLYVNTGRDLIFGNVSRVHYRQSLALAEELGMRPLVAHCHLGLGTLHSRIGRVDQARTDLAAAIEMYRAMDMTFWLPQAEAALAQVDGR